MLALTIRPEAGPLRPPDPSDEGVEVWRDLSGVVCLLGERRGELCRLHVVGLAQYEFTAASPEVTAQPRPGANPALVVDQFYRTVLPLALQARGLEVLHASAVRTPRGVVALCAAKLNGKSTLAYALGARGYPPCADDAVVLETGPGAGVTTLSVPFALRLRPSSSAHFGAGGAPIAGLDRDPREPIRLEPAPLGGLFVLRRSPGPTAPGGSAVEVVRLEAGAALAAVLENAYAFTLADEARKRRFVESYLRLVHRVPVWEVRYGTGLERLPEILDALEAAFGDTTSATVDG